MSVLETPDRKAPERLARSVAKTALRAYGTLTSPMRGLPDFIIIGGKRCGTTSMHDYITKHPLVAPLFPRAQKIKGVHYFDTNYHRGGAWYRSHFPSRSYLARVARRAGRSAISGEASPYYLFHPLAARRARSEVAGVKLIVLLRNPVDRAYSHYRERVRHGAESCTFEEALDMETERLAGEEERLIADERYYSAAHENFSYFEQGRYARALQRWFDNFPRDRFLFLVSENVFASPDSAYSEVTRFLGLPEMSQPKFDKLNYHSGSPMAKSTRAALTNRYRADNMLLEQMLDLDLSHWS